MRNKISLYINNTQVDLNDQSFILFNYTQEDLSNPTIVKNSYTQQITLPGTQTNNNLFNGIYNLDRLVTAGSFNPSIKTPFVIYNEMCEILESGYMKLDNIIKEGKSYEYKITLYGGLGSFLYSLAYDGQGNKRTLADLEYLDTSNSATELDFTINKESVQEAWTALANGTAGKWKVINFAPAYNGIPDKNFSADKAIIVPSSVGLSDQTTFGGVTYRLRGGSALVSFAEAQDEYAVKDMRSYLQRPVFSISAFLNAISQAKNNGGYTLDVSSISSMSYNNLWMTLPMLSSLTPKKNTTQLSLSFDTNRYTDDKFGRISIVGNAPIGIPIKSVFSIQPQLVMSSATESYLYDITPIEDEGTKLNLMFLQVLAYSSDGTLVGASDVKCNYGNRGEDCRMIADECGFVPVSDDENMKITSVGYDAWTLINYAQKLYGCATSYPFTIEAENVSYYVVKFTSYEMEEFEMAGGGTSRSYEETTSHPVLYKSTTGQVSSTNNGLAQAGDSSVSFASADTLRSNAKVTKETLLSTSNTPADYLLSFCKMFGLYMRYDSVTKVVTICTRDDLYMGGDIDLTEMIDTGSEISVTPLLFSSKWYDFSLESVGGSFCDEYKQIYGSEYGSQRVNTGYDFNSDVTKLMDSNVFKNAATILARSKYFNIITDNGYIIPSPFLDKGNKYTLWASDGSTLDRDISCPPSSATTEYYNTGYEGYDKPHSLKCEFRDADNKSVSGENVLVMFNGFSNYPYFKLSDDTATMALLNDGVPCWTLEAGTASGINIPLFSRYSLDEDEDYEIWRSLDFGTPKELDMPPLRYLTMASIYSRRWRRYLTDRFDVNTCTMTCKVRFKGMKVNADLLRRFYWYDNSLWTLNSIKNYSLTTNDPVECEFIKVQDKENYTEGQI